MVVMVAALEWRFEAGVEVQVGLVEVESNEGGGGEGGEGGGGGGGEGKEGGGGEARRGGGGDGEGEGNKGGTGGKMIDAVIDEEQPLC